jgi:UDP-GlcNAc:undecaprenyl-phosphate GlcNAc-1-phosphate transferase
VKIYFILFFVAALCSWLLTPLVARLGHHLRAYGCEREKGKFVPIPRLGGIAIFAASLVAWFALPIVAGGTANWFPFGWRYDCRVVATLLVPAALVLLLGAYDDLRRTRPWQKLVVETAAAAIAWQAGSRILSVPFLGFPIHSAAISFLLTVIWIVAATNAFNLIDGLDGLASGVAFFVAVSLFLVSLLQGSPLAAMLALTLAGALVGFLRFNFVPAKIFLGDAGSLFLGFLLALLAARASLKSRTVVAIAAPYVAFGLPLLDTSLAVVRRFLSARPLFEPDCDHIHHRLLGRKFTPRSAVLFLYALAVFFSLGSLLILRSTGSPTLLVLMLAVVTAWFLWHQLRYEELSGLAAHLLRALRTQRRVLACEIRIRKVAKQIDSAPSLEKSWELLVEAITALGFDEIAFRFPGRRGHAAPFLRPWRQSGTPYAERAWTASVPLGAGEGALGELRLRRAIGNDRLNFPLSWLLETLLPPFERQLKRRYERGEPEPLFAYSLQGVARRTKHSVLANQRGKA